MLPPEVLSALARFFGVSTDYILGLTDVQQPYPQTKSSVKLSEHELP